MIDIIGNFGSRLSYATVADRVARALIERDALGSLINLDDRFMDPAFAKLPRSGTKGNKALLLSTPHGYMVDALCERYDRKNVAIFLCPNTVALSTEHRSSAEKVGRIYAPSKWCADTIVASTTLDVDVEVVPFGVDDPFADHRTGPVLRSGGQLNFLHMTTDTFWPGRKGTEELLHAWNLFRTRTRTPIQRAKLTIHCLPQLHPQVYRLVGDLDLLDDVEIASSDPRGLSPGRLFDLIRDCDVFVAPSRSEGFGVMPLSALCAGRAVCTTAGTGQDEYLFDEEVRPVDWVQIPTCGQASLAGEHGDAPVVRAEQMVPSLLAAMVMVNENMISQQDRAFCEHWSWRTRAAAWAASLIKWNESDDKV